MADWRDVMDARGDARAAADSLTEYGSSIEDGGASDTALAVGLAALAVCSEIRALAVLIDYARGDAR